MRPGIAVDRLDRAAILEENQGGRHPHAVAHGGLLGLIGVDFNYLQVPREIAGKLLEVWFKLAAGAAAWGEEFDQDRNIRLPDFLVERRVICLVQHDANYSTKKRFSDMVF